MNNRTRFNFITVALFLVFCICVVYCMPKAKYMGKVITADIMDAIPKNSQHWQGRDIENIPNKLGGDVYNFISRIFARQYINSSHSGQAIVLVVLDAGNFHYPKVCFQGVGFTSQELPLRELALKPGRIPAHLLLSKKAKEAVLSIYWICINKKIVSSWAEQKIKQLYYSLFNKERVGLMVRLDIPVTEDIEKCIGIAEDFLNDICQEIPFKYRDYIFGSI